MFKIQIIQKLIVDLRTLQDLIGNCKLIHDYYNDYLKYQIKSIEVLPFYQNSTHFMAFDNSF